jgi:hypothetical protein
VLGLQATARQQDMLAKLWPTTDALRHAALLLALLHATALLWTVLQTKTGTRRAARVWGPSHQPSRCSALVNSTAE